MALFSDPSLELIKAKSRNDSNPSIIGISVPAITLTHDGNDTVLQESQEIVVRTKKSFKASLKKSLKTACDIELMKRPEFQILILSRSGYIQLVSNIRLFNSVNYVFICRLIGFFPLDAFYMFYPQYLITNGLTELDASVALSVMGLAGTLGRGLIGIVTDRSKFKKKSILRMFYFKYN